MRIAVLVIGLFLTLLVGLQSCAVYVGGGLAKNQSISGGGATGIIIAFLFVLGAAFAMGLPRVSMVLFIVAALLGLGVGATTQFHDMTIWGVVAAVLAVMSFFGWRELRKKVRP